jgi:arylsulfatase A-like enzyme
MNPGASFTCGILSLAATTIAAETQAPNVIVIVADQLRYQSVGYAGDKKAITPNLDRLASQSVNFCQFVANSPVCSAFRGSFLTGKYASSTGLAVNELRMNPNQDSIAHLFSRNHYACDLIGKWHLWAAESNHNKIHNAYTPPGPYRMGFDAFWAGYNFNHQNYQASYFRDSPDPQRIQGFGDATFTDLAIERVRTHAKLQQPFFLLLSLSTPHDPWTKANVPAQWYERFKDVEFPLPDTWSDVPDPYMDRNADPQKWIAYWKPHLTEFQRVYYAMTAALDEQVGRLLAAIDDAGVRDRTIVVFTSDHGEMFGAHGRVYKMSFYEESVRTPLLIRWPGRIPAGSRSNACVSTVDLMPTLLGLAGCDIPKAVEGMDLAHLVLGKGGPEPEGALLQGMGHTYLWQDGFEWRALRNKRFTYARYLRDGREWLFDHTTDPSQKFDLSSVSAHLDDLKLLRGQMDQRMNQIGDSFEKCSWYRDHFTENRVIVSGARGIFHREFGADVPVDTSRPKPL